MEFRQGLNEVGFVEGQNLAIAFRWAEGRFERLASLATELVALHVAVIVAFGGAPAAQAAEAATSTIPIVFAIGTDPVRMGLVQSLNRPGGNVTGVNYFVGELGSKQLGLLHQFNPAAKRVGALVNPNNAGTELWTKDVVSAASAMGLRIEFVQASDSRAIESAFGSFVRNKIDALLVGPDAVFVRRRLQLAILAARYVIPTVYNVREYAAAGGLMSYGTSVLEADHQVGIYAGKILKGAKPADLPVMQSSKFELIINLITARALGLDVPAQLLAVADEVIE
jgi:putative ABC transport system substrate-binding protein